MKENANERKAELYRPSVVDRLIKSGKARCKVLDTPCGWFGVTFKEDKPVVMAKFKELTEKGVYPSPLFSHNEGMDINKNE